MHLKPNEVYSAIIEIAATADRTRSLSEYLTALRRLLAEAPEPISIGAFLDLLAAPARPGAAGPAIPGPERGELARRGGGGRDEALGVLDAQLRDLGDMERTGQLADEKRDFGLTAPSGAEWNAFDVGAYLEGAAWATFYALDPEGPEIETLTWHEVAMFLSRGQRFE